MSLPAVLQINRGTFAAAPVLADGELYWCEDTFQVLVGYSGTNHVVGVGAGGPPTGSAGGDLTGTYPNPTVAANKITAGKMAASASNILFGRSTSGAGAGEEITCTAAGRALIDDSDAAAQRTTLGLGTISTQDANNVTITGGSITGITDLLVADGGTGASSLTAHGVVIGQGTNPVAVTAVGTAGQLFLGQSATDDPLFATMSGDATIGTGGVLTLTSHGAFAYRSGSNLTLTQSAFTTCLWDAEYWDTDSYHSTSSNTGRFTIPTGRAGYYLCIGSCEVSGATSTTGLFLRWSRYNSSSVAQLQLSSYVDNIGTSTTFSPSYAAIHNCVAGDYLQFELFHSSTGTVVMTNNTLRSWAQVIYMGA